MKKGRKRQIYLVVQGHQSCAEVFREQRGFFIDVASLALLMLFISLFLKAAGALG